MKKRTVTQWNPSTESYFLLLRTELQKNWLFISVTYQKTTKSSECTENHGDKLQWQPEDKRRNDGGNG